MFKQRKLLTAVALFIAVFFQNVPLRASEEGGHESEKPAASAEETIKEDKSTHEAVPDAGVDPNQKAKHDEKDDAPKIDASKYEFYDSPQSLSDLDTTDVGKLKDDGIDTAIDSNTDIKIAYITPKSCGEFSVYMDGKQRQLHYLEDQINQKQAVLENLKSEFEQMTRRYAEVEARVQKLVQRGGSTDLKENPEMVKMLALYESLSAEEAAARLKNLDLDLTLAILKGMKPKKLTQIMTAFEPQLAAALSSQMVRGF